MKRFYITITLLWIIVGVCILADNKLIWKEPIQLLNDPLPYSKLEQDKNGDVLTDREGNEYSVLLVYVTSNNTTLEDLDLRLTYRNTSDVYRKISKKEGIRYYKFYIESKRNPRKLKLTSEKFLNVVDSINLDTSWEWKPGKYYKTSVEFIREDIITLNINTSQPKCTIIYNVNEENWESDMQGRLLKTIPAYGMVVLEATKYGFVSEIKNINLNRLRKDGGLKGDTLYISFDLKESVNFRLQVPSYTNVKLKNTGTKETRDLGDAGGTINTDVSQGEYNIELRKNGYKTFTKSVTITNETKYIIIKEDELIPINGQLQLYTTPSTGVSVFVDGAYIAKTPLKEPLTLKAGTHNIKLSKSGHTPITLENVTIDEDRTTNLGRHVLNKSADRWWPSSENFPQHYLEAQYGLGLTEPLTHYAGLNYTYIPYALGFYLSGMYGITNRDIIATIGTALTMTKQSKTDLDLQLLLGGGYAHLGSGSGTWAVDASLRFGFDEAIEYNWWPWGWWSINIGTKYYNKTFVPTIGLSFIPLRGLVALGSIREYLPPFACEAIGAYSFTNEEWLFGTNFSWNKTHLGIYGQFMVGLQKSSTINIGPTFRLTTDDCVADLQLYQGIGWSKFGSNSFGGESGIRLGWKTDNKYQLFSLIAGVNYSTQHDLTIHFGMSWALAGIISSLGLGALALQ